MASFFKKVIVREVASVNRWEVSSDVRPLIENAEREIDLQWKSQLGINPQLMMPGNYARVMFEANELILLELITDQERKKNLQNVLRIFRELRRVYRSNDPMTEFPQDVKNYKLKAVGMGKILVTDFAYVPWPNYLHKIIEHVQELIEDDSGVRSVGSLSGEGNEAGNKLFRHFRLHHARRGNTYHGLRDVLWLHWLYTSPKLRKLSEVYHRQNRCTRCYQVGHNIRTCKMTVRTDKKSF